MFSYLILRLLSSNHNNLIVFERVLSRGGDVGHLVHHVAAVRVGELLERWLALREVDPNEEDGVRLDVQQLRPVCVVRRIKEAREVVQHAASLRGEVEQGLHGACNDTNNQIGKQQKWRRGE